MAHTLAGRGLVVGACLLVFVGTACTPSEPPSPPPTSTSAPTPVENAQEREERLAYAAAEKSYREFRAEFNRLTAAGGTANPTLKLRETSGGQYQKELVETLRAFKTAGYRTRGEEVIPPIHRTGYSRNSLLIEACEDDRAVKTVDRAGKQVDAGDVLVVNLEVRKIDAQWKVWSGSGTEASTCDDF